VTTLASTLISISYSQLCVFDAKLPEPYNEWQPQHNAQGFSWRPGSVSFATAVDRGACEVLVELSPTMPEIGDAHCVIAVPFDVPPDGEIEVGSIMSGVPLTVPSGPHRLFFLDYGEEAKRLRLVFAPGDNQAPEVIRESGNIRRQSKYLMTSRPG
jgi:Competence protein J (ComJ)